MSPREFIGYCYCDSKFKTIENIIKNGTLEEVLEIKAINDKMPKFHRHLEVYRLLSERLK
jgi:hypothetical protein